MKGGEPPGQRPPGPPPAGAPGPGDAPPRKPASRSPRDDRAKPAVQDPSRLRVWLDQRTGYSALIKLITQEPIPGGARWWLVFGAVLTFLFVLELVTGVLLAAHYDPSATGAWASTAFIQDSLSFGWFIRGLHSFGSTALIVVAVIHALQVVLFGAYRAPREMTWLSGVIFMGLLLLFALSGYGLPWDEAGYAAKQVDFTITGTAPLIGPALQKVLQGGDVMGNYTVTHLNAAHTLLLPAVAVALLVGHVALVKRHGVTPRWNVNEVTLARATRPYWPYQAARDALACGLMFAILVCAVVATRGAALGGPADPTGSYQARPEWYMLPLYQLRKAFEGPLEMLVVLLAPAAVVLIVSALPWIDRARERAPRRRLPVLIAVALGTVGLAVLGYLPVRRDQNDRAFQRSRAEAAERAQRSRALAMQGVPPEGGLAVYRNDPSHRVRELWNERCAKCHTFIGPGAHGPGDGSAGAAPAGGGAGPKAGPDLKGYGTRTWIAGFLHDPRAPGYMGSANIDRGMKAVSGTREEIDALAELVYAETGARDVDRARVARGRQLLSTKDCDSCHDLDGTSGNTGPNLKGYGTLAYLVDVIADASDERLYGAKNQMPRFANKLTPDEIADLARFVLEEARR